MRSPGIDPTRSMRSAGQLMQKMFGSIRDSCSSTPICSITRRICRWICCAIRPSSTASRRRASSTLLHNAYSQNYTYLIKKPNDQYQVILEVADTDRADPQNLNLLYIKSDDGQRMVPLRAVTQWKPMLGPQAVNHINQFTSVTHLLQPQARLHHRRRPRSSWKTRPSRSCRSTCAGSLQGEALTFRDTVSSLTILMVLAVFVMYVILAILYESYLHPITVLSSLPVALVGGLADAVALQRRGFALRVHRHVHADGHREEERHHDRGLRAAARGAGHYGR